MALSMKSQPCHKKHFLAYVFLCLFHIFVVVDGQAAFQAYSGNRRRRRSYYSRRRGMPSPVDNEIIIVNNGLCFQSARYGSSRYDDYEDTTIKVLRSGTLNVESWSGECSWDFLTWPGSRVCSSPQGRSVSAGNLMRWTSDGSVGGSGFKVCLSSNDCTHVSGNTRNSQDCKCGTAVCTATTGRYCISSSSSCFTCLTGQKKSSANACISCTAGFYQNQIGSFTSCKSCPKGFYQASNQATSCTSCGAGKYGNQNNVNQVSHCKVCPNGYYQASNGKTSCTSCGAGKYSTQSSAINSNGCTNCGVGKFSTSVGAAESTCTACGLGKFSTELGRTTDCTSCVPGRYIDQTGQTSCKLCVEGKHNLQLKSESSTACLNCAAGKYQYRPAASSCVRCRIGHFANQTGSERCLPCSPGTYAPRMNATACMHCGTLSCSVSAPAG